MKKENPCKKCPWTKKGQPDITKELIEANNKGAWFCCHVNTGTCYGAEKMKGKIKRNESR